MYCIVEIYEEYIPGDLGPMFSQEPDYSTQFETLEGVKSFCDAYNEKHKNDFYVRYINSFMSPCSSQTMSAPCTSAHSKQIHYYHQ